MDGDGEQPDTEESWNYDAGERSTDESDGRDLTPEEERQLRVAAARIRNALNPSVTSALAGIQRSGMLDRVLKDMDKWKNLGVGHSILERALGNGVLTSSFDTARLAHLMPKASLEPSWVRQLGLINSDAYKMTGIGQSTLTGLPRLWLTPDL